MSNYKMDKSVQRLRDKKIWQRVCLFGENPRNLARELILRPIDVERIVKRESKYRGKAA